MKTRLAVLVVVAAATFAASAALPARAPVVGTQSAYANHCYKGKKGGYVHADFPWGQRCIRAGQFCKKVRNPEYHKYKFQCVNGKLRMQKKKKGK